MSFLILSTNQDFVVGLSLLLIGLILAIVISLLMWLAKNQSRRNNLKPYNHQSNWWGFIKKNFPLFLVLFFIIMAITGLTMIIA